MNNEQVIINTFLIQLTELLQTLLDKSSVKPIAFQGILFFKIGFFMPYHYV